MRFERYKYSGEKGLRDCCLGTPGRMHPTLKHESRNLWIISYFVERRSCILSENVVFSMGSEDRGFPVWQISRLPGQKSRQRNQNRRWFLFRRMRASAVSSQAISFPRFTFDLCSWGESLDWARGRRRDSRKHRPGILLSAAKPK